MPRRAARRRQRGVGRHGQRGVALIIALILVALAAILATKVSYDGYLERRRTIGVLAAEQALHFAMGAEALAADVLTQDLQNNKGQVTLAGIWAQQAQPMPLTPENDPEGEPIGTLEGSLEDMQGRFNLNELGRMVHQPNGAPDIPDPQPFDQFTRILVMLQLEPKWAQLARDWIDADDQPGPDGAEDSVYTAQNPPYRTGNWPMLSTTELMSLPGFGIDRYRKLAPYVTALPILATPTPINICTASGIVLDSLGKHMNDYSGNAELLVTSRKTGCFPDLVTFGNVLGSEAAGIAGRYSDKSSYFRLTTRVTLGTNEFTLYSLLQRKDSGKVTSLLRNFGSL
jgi:general secretion pathway protein K